MFRMWARSAAVIFSLLLLVVSAPAQRVPRPSSIQLHIHGQVRYAPGARAAEFVLVRLESFRGGVIAEVQTDRTGKFIFTGLGPELYIVSIRTPGYKEVQQQVDLSTQPSDYVQFQLVAEDPKIVPASSTKRPGVVDANVPTKAREEFEKGRDALLQTNNLNEGILHLQKAVTIYPKYLEALLMLGTAYMDTHDWPNAEGTLRQVLALDPKIIGAHFALGELYFRQKRYPDAETEMLAGIKLDDRSVQGHYMLGRLYYEMGNLAKAGPHVGTALQLNPRFARGHLLAGNILLHARQPENALVEFEEYIRLEPKGEFVDEARATAQKIRRALAKG
jgi:Flp pilus assembly protein TadD